MTQSSAVADALAALPSSHRETLRLARQGHSYRQIAERLGMSVEHVRIAAFHSVLALTQARRGSALRLQPD